VPSTSTAPLISKPAAVIVPKPAIFLLPSRTTALEAAPVPAVIPSSSSSSASARTALPAVNPVPVTIPVEVIAPEPTVPAKVTFAPLKVAAVVVPDLIMRLPDVLVKLPKVVPASFTKTSPPLASNIISPSTSKVKSPASDIVLPFIVISSTVKVVNVPSDL